MAGGVEVQLPEDAELIADFEIPWDLHWSGRNKLDGCHYRTKKQVFGQARERAYQSWLAAGKPGDGNQRRVHLKITLYRDRRLDAANLVDGLKPLQDALFSHVKEGHGMTPHDSPKWLPKPPDVDYVVGKEWGRYEQGAKFRLQVWAYGEPVPPAPPQPARPKKPKPPLTGEAALEALRKAEAKRLKPLRPPSYRKRRSW